MKIRVVKTASKAKAVQIIRYENNKRVIVQHNGSADNDENLNELIFIGEEWIKDYSNQPLFFLMNRVYPKISRECLTLNKPKQ